jgi:NAD(P)-dependent dehydrogenase (short-subunit alcohol dehydrogenase family)
MQTIVITGSTRGIGYGLADSFLGFGCQVVLSGREIDSVDQAVQRLTNRHPGCSLTGHQCDVRKSDQVRSLWDQAIQIFNQVDVWINNAGLSGPYEPILQGSADMSRKIIETNLLGVIHGSRIAAEEMIKQGSGTIYNMEGLGSDGRRLEGLAIYGTSKIAVRYFTQSLIDELKGTPVRVGSIQPGMVVTDLLTSHYQNRPEDWERAKRIFNILAERVEVVTPWIARKILKNPPHGARLSYASRWKLILRFLTAPLYPRNIFEASD